MSWALWGVAGWLVIIGMYHIAKIGKPQEPLKSTEAAWDIVFLAWAVVVVCLAAWRLR